MNTLVAGASSVRNALLEGKRILGGVSEEAAREAELLLMHTLCFGRTRLYQNLNDQLSTRESEQYRSVLNRRLAHEPTPYILGHREFFGLDFDVTPAAIIPRPETETLVELAIAFTDPAGNSPVTIVDVGTGSGAIAIALARAIPESRLIAIDLSPDALSLAEDNATRHDVTSQIRFLRGDLLAPLDTAVDIIVANLPYVTTVDWQLLPPEIRDHEPRVGLDGGSDGLRLIARLLEQARVYLKPGGALIAEIGDTQRGAVTVLAQAAFGVGPRISIKRDLAGLDRVLVVET